MRSLEYYSPSDTFELYDKEADIFYNQSGQMLRHPDSYNNQLEGYTPFGDE